MAFALKTTLFLLALAYGTHGYIEHSGAYSSPQYAKKSMQYIYNRQQPIEYQKIESSTPEPVRSKFQEIDISNHTEFQVQRPTQFSNELATYNAESQTARSTGFMAAAGSFLSGRGGQMIADIARDLISRSTGASSQVLSLNLTNLVILVVLKALILAVGMFGAGTWGHGYARNLESENSPWLSEDELALWLGYLYNRNDNCLANAACRSPELARKYCGGADILLTVSNLFNSTIPHEEHQYENIIQHVKRAANVGAAGMECNTIFQCSKY